MIKESLVKYILGFIGVFSILFVFMTSIDASSLFSHDVYYASSASHIALGTAAFTNDSNSVFLHDVFEPKRFALSGFSVETMPDYHIQSASFAKRFGSFVIGLGHCMSGNDSLIATTRTGIDNEHVQSGSYAYQNRVSKVMINSRLNENLSLGLGLSLVDVSIDTDMESALTFSSSVLFHGNSHLSHVLLSLSNINEPNLGHDSIPLRVSTAFHYSVNDTLAVIPTITMLSQEQLDKRYLLSCGLRYHLTRFFVPMISVAEQVHANTIKRSFRIGATLHVFGLGVGYAYKTTDYSHHQSQHFFSVNVTI